MREAAREALEVCAFDLAGRAANAAPIESGRLRGSVSPGGDPTFGGNPDAEVRELGDRFEVSVTFSTPYAHAQHEGYIDYEIDGKPVHVEFKNHPRGGGKKYLEGPLKAMAPRYEAVIAAKVKEAMERVDATS